MPQIHIKVDTNDADYSTAVSIISQEDLDIIKPLIEAIKNFKPYKGEPMDSGRVYTHSNNWPYGECCREDMGEKTPEEIYSDFDEEVIEIFQDYCPYPEYGFHTIKEIVVYPDSVGETLL